MKTGKNALRTRQDAAGATAPPPGGWNRHWYHNKPNCQAL